ncbi:hypothetical protein P3W45_000360 [Vairimorpha bombi]
MNPNIANPYIRNINPIVKIAVPCNLSKWSILNKCDLASVAIPINTKIFPHIISALSSSRMNPSANTDIPIRIITTPVSFSKRFSAEFIVIVHNLKFAGLIDHKEFINLMTFVSDQVWFIKIYNHMVDIIIKRILNTPISDLLSAKCLYFQYFIMIQLKTLINEKDVSDSANKITKSMQKDYLAGKDLIDAMQDAYVASIQVKLVIKLIIFTFSKNIGGNRMLEFIHFLYEDGRPRQNIFDSNDYTKVKRHLVNSLRREGNSGSLVGYRRYFKRFYRCQA